MKRWLISGFITALCAVILGGCYIRPIPIYQQPYQYYGQPVYYQGGAPGWRGYRLYPGVYRTPGWGWGWHGHGGGWGPRR